MTRSLKKEYIIYGYDLAQKTSITISLIWTRFILRTFCKHWPGQDERDVAASPASMTIHVWCSVVPMVKSSAKPNPDETAIRKSNCLSLIFPNVHVISPFSSGDAGFFNKSEPLSSTRWRCQVSTVGYISSQFLYIFHFLSISCADSPKPKMSV